MANHTNDNLNTLETHARLSPSLEPEHLATEYSEVPPPILTRSEREREEAVRICNMSVSRRGPQKQHRCLWQLAKFMVRRSE